MSKRKVLTKTEGDISEEKEILFQKLCTIFDPTTAWDFVSPKTYEPRQQATIEDLTKQTYEQPTEHFQRLRSMDHYQTTIKSLSRPDLEASYQAFIRDQVGQHRSRDELEQFVRNASDIDAAQRYLDSAVDTRLHPPKSELLFQSSKLNEEKALLFKTTRPHKSLRQLNEDASLDKYFLQHESSSSTPRTSTEEQDDDDDDDFNKIDQQQPPPPQLLEVNQGEKRYRITFVKNSEAFKYLSPPLRRPIPDPRTRSFHHQQQQQQQQERRNLESLFSGETSTIHGRSSVLNTTNIHREIFPPLSLSALKEYRPTINAKPLSASTIRRAQTESRKTFYKTDFIWEQSIVSPKDQ